MDLENLDLTKIEFLSANNYLKRSSELSGSTTLALPPNSFTPSYHTIKHNLGYVPFVSVACDLNGDGTIWANNIVNTETQSSSGGSVVFPKFFYYVTTTDLVIYLLNSSTPQTGSRNIYWNIYLDYANS